MIPSVSERGSFRVKLGVLLAFIAGPLAVGAYYGFPVFDDGYYLLLLKEQGPAAMVPAHPDRPPYGMLLQLVAATWGSSVLPLVLIDIGLWVAFAVLAATLWNRLCPGYRQYSFVVACLVLAPIVVRIQLSTVTVLIPCLIPTLLSYTALVLILNHYERQRRWTAVLCWVGSVVAGLGALLSEYAVASAAACAVVAAGYRSPATVRLDRLKRYIPIALLLVCVLLAYGMLLAVSDPMARPAARPSFGTHRLGAVPANALHYTRSVVQVLAGSYAQQAGRFQPYWDSKWTIVPILYGILVSLSLWHVTTSKRLMALGRDGDSRMRSVILPAAALAGLVPVAWMGRDTTQPVFSSRLLLPVLPLAVMVTISWSFLMVKARYRQLLVMFFGFLAGSATLDTVIHAVKDQRLAGAISVALRPHLLKATGPVVAVIDPESDGLTRAGNLSGRWPVEQSRHFWVVGPVEAKTLFGNRNACPERPQIAIDVRTIRRVGRIEELLFVDASNPSDIYVEPYCHGGKTVSGGSSHSQDGAESFSRSAISERAPRADR